MEEALAPAPKKHKKYYIIILIIFVGLFCFFALRYRPVIQVSNNFSGSPQAYAELS